MTGVLPDFRYHHPRTPHSQLRFDKSQIFKKTKMDYWSNKMANNWTLERCKKQGELIWSWQPWANSTGPKTDIGKFIVSQSACKDGLHTSGKQWHSN
jgi:hypothetical protein